MRALVTGSTGFLGSALVNALKCPVVALVRDETPNAPNLNATICYGDLSDVSRLERIIAEHRIDTVFALAAQTEVAVGVSDPTGTFESNIRGLWNTLEASRRQKVKRIIVASTDKVYGRSKPPYTEKTEFNPDRPYDASKACADILARTYASTYKMSIVVTRCVNLYGPNCQTLSTIIPNTIRRVMRGERPIIRNGGMMKRDFLYIDDAVEAYLKLAESDYVGPMNFGSGTGHYIKDISKLILKIMKSDLKPIDEKDEMGEIEHQWSDASLARKVIGWRPQHTLEAGLFKTVESYTGEKMTVTIGTPKNTHVYWKSTP